MDEFELRVTLCYLLVGLIDGSFKIKMGRLNVIRFGNMIIR